MVQIRHFIRRHKIIFSIISLIFIGIPQYVDTVWSLFEKIQSGGIGLNITWLYAITAPVGLGMLVYIIIQSKRLSEDDINIAWSHYNRITDMIISLEKTPIEKWSEIIAGIQRELNGIHDNKMNELIKLFFDVVDEDEHFGFMIDRTIINQILDITRDRMNKKFGSICF